MRFAALISGFALLTTLIVPASLLAQDTANAPASAPAQAPVPAVEALHDASPAPQPQPAAVRDLSDAESVATTSAISTVSIEDGSSQSAYRFNPKALSVSAGDTVTWTNDGQQPHNVTGDGLKSKTLNHGNTYSFTFNDPGTYNYKCTIHPYMKGSVTVSDSGSGGGGSGTDNGSSSTGSDTTGTGGTAAAGSSSTVPSTTGTTGTTGTTATTGLPSTGLDAVLLTEIGLALLLAGAVLRELLLRRRNA